MAFDPKAVTGLTKKIKERNSGGTSRVFRAKGDLQIDAPVLIRLRKPQPNQGGEWAYAVEVVTYWFKKKPYISRAVFGEDDPLAAALEEIRGFANDKAHPDHKTFAALLADFNQHSVDTAFWMPANFIEVGEDGETFAGLSSKHDILAANPQLADQINDIVLSPKVLAKSKENGIFDRKSGYAISLSKTKTGTAKTDVKYKAERDEQVEMPADLWAPEKTADIMAYLEKIAPSAEYAMAALNNYFYGDDMPEKDVWKKVVDTGEDDEAEQDVERDEPEKKPTVRRPVAADKPAAAPTRRPAATSGTPAKTPVKPQAGRNLVEDLEAGFDDE